MAQTGKFREGGGVLIYFEWEIFVMGKIIQLTDNMIMREFNKF